MTATRFFTILGGSALLLLGLVAIAARAMWQWQHDVVMWVMLASAVVYAAAAWRVWGATLRLSVRDQRRALALILVTAALARGILVFTPPVSTDIYRYVWDGRVQAAGINPYRYRPADADLGFLRDAAVYPNINRKASALTVYPPLAQVIFFGVTRIANSVTGMKAAMVGFEILTIAVLLSLLRSRGLPATRILVYAWHPLPLFEFAGSGHIDAAAIALMLLACWFAQRRQQLTAGAVLGAAVAVKFFPLVIAPALYRRWGWRLPLALAGVVIALYLPYVGVGWQVLGFLPGYVHEEGLANGSGFFLLDALGDLAPLPAWTTAVYLLAGTAVLAAIAWRTILRSDGSTLPMTAALVLMSVFTLWVSPHLAWYFSWIVPFMCFRLSWALVYLSAAAPLLYRIIWMPGTVALDTALYAPFTLVLGLEIWVHYHRSQQETLNDGRLRSRHAS